MQRGLLAVAALFASCAAVYWPHVLAAGLPFAAQFSYFAASCAVLCMALGLVLAARPRVIEGAFGGLDRMYQLHKWLGVAALVLFVAHFLTVPGGAGDGAAPGAPGGADADEEGLPIDLFGQLAMIGFLALIIVTLNRRIAYHRWFATHQLMGLVFLVAAVHVALVLLDGADIRLASPPGLMLAGLLLTGLAAYVYRQLWYGRHRRPFDVVAVNRLERATEVVLRPRAGRLHFEPGQFAFLTIDAAGFREAHPFTIASGANEDRLRVTMKVLGDYTRRVHHDLAPGAAVEVEGPYGRFTPLRGPARQVWVAGGIGITPFLSVLRTLAGPAPGKTVRLYYCVRTAGEALFLGELETLAAGLDGVTVTLVASDGGPRLTAARIAADLEGGPGAWSCWLCGPKPMVAGLTADLVRCGVPAGGIHAEEFELR